MNIGRKLTTSTPRTSLDEKIRSDDLFDFVHIEEKISGRRATNIHADA